MEEISKDEIDKKLQRILNKYLSKQNDEDFNKIS